MRTSLTFPHRDGKSGAGWGFAVAIRFAHLDPKIYSDPDFPKRANQMKIVRNQEEECCGTPALSSSAATSASQAS